MAEISYRRHRFPPVIIQHAVWLYLRFTLSYRDVEELLAERGLDVSYETVRSWVLKFGPIIARRLRCGRHDVLVLQPQLRHAVFMPIPVGEKNDRRPVHNLPNRQRPDHRVYVGRR
jgi:hypothetical protein